MSTDINKFDTSLKKNLAIDLCFRSVIWLGIAAVAAYFAITESTLTPLQYFERVGFSLMPVVNSLGVGGLLLALLALLLKDLEATMKDQERIEATRGWFGGLVRRLAGDLTLWTFGALVTFMAVFAVALVLARPTRSEMYAVAGLALLIGMLAVFTGVLNVYVRRNGPSPLVKWIQKPVIVALLYGVMLAALVLRPIAAA